MFLSFVQSFPQDKQKMKTGLSGWLYAYEVPPPPTMPSSPSPSPTPITPSKISPVVEGDRVSENKVLVEEEKAVGKHSMEAVSNNLQKESSDDIVTENDVKVGDSSSNDDVVNNGGALEDNIEQTTAEVKQSNGDPSDVLLDADERTNQLSAVLKSDCKKKGEVPPNKLPTYCSPSVHGFLFAIHRKTVSVFGWFVSIDTVSYMYM